MEIENKRKLVLAKAFGEWGQEDSEEVKDKQFRDPADLFAKAQENRGN